MEVLFKDDISEKTISDFPQTRYQGSKHKLLAWIWENISFLDFETVADLFGGTGAVSYMFKTHGKAVTFNDILKSNFYGGRALIENSDCRLSRSEAQRIVSEQTLIGDALISRLFKGIYYNDDENAWLDRVIQNIYFNFADSSLKKSLCLWAIFQACIIKRPFNLFHRKNLYLRTNHVNRTFGNKTTWDRPFEAYFLKFIRQANHAIFDNGKKCVAFQKDAIELKDHYDLVYIDTPYISSKGVGVDYFHFYHFLEGLADYFSWEKRIDFTRKHLPLVQQPNRWLDKTKIMNAFYELVDHFQKSHIVISYRSDGIPTIDELIVMVKQFKKNQRLVLYPKYKYVLSKNNKSSEILILGWD